MAERREVNNRDGEERCVTLEAALRRVPPEDAARAPRPRSRGLLQGTLQEEHRFRSPAFRPTVARPSSQSRTACGDGPERPRIGTRAGAPRSADGFAVGRDHQGERRVLIEPCPARGPSLCRPRCAARGRSRLVVPRRDHGWQGVTRVACSEGPGARTDGVPRRDSDRAEPPSPRVALRLRPLDADLHHPVVRRLDEHRPSSRVGAIRSGRWGPSKVARGDRATHGRRGALTPRVLRPPHG